jgi:hypothetical protein
MTESEIFERRVNAWGGALNTEYLESENALAKAFNEMTIASRSWVAAAQKGIQNPPKVYFGFVRNGLVNAWAFKQDGMYFVAVTTGTLFMRARAISRHWKS